MSVDWGSLATVLVVGLAVTCGLVGLFTLGIAGLSRGAVSAAAGGSGAPLARAGAWVCFAAAAAAVVYGIVLIAG